MDKNKPSRVAIALFVLNRDLKGLLVLRNLHKTLEAPIQKVLLFNHWEGHNIIYRHKYK